MDNNENTKIDFNKFILVFAPLSALFIFVGGWLYIASRDFFKDREFINFNINANYFYYPGSPGTLFTFMALSLLIGLLFIISIIMYNKIYHLISRLFVFAERIIKVYPLLFLFVFLFPVVTFLYRDHIFNNTVIENAFFRIPEEYFIVLSDNAVEYENTTKLYNELNLLGHDKVDINSFQNWQNNRACRYVGEVSAPLKILLKQYKSSFMLRAKFGGTKFYSPDQSALLDVPELFYLNGSLCLIFSADDAANIILIEKLNNLNIEFNDYYNFVHESSGNQDTLRCKNNKDTYFKCSESETYHQIFNRGSLSHHMHYLMPAKEYSLGKPLKDISSQYGLGLTLIPAALSKIFAGGKMEYGTFLRFSSFLFPLGFIIFVISIYALFRDLSRIILPTALLILNHFSLTYDIFQLSTGIGNYRVLLDLPLLYFTHKYFERQTVASILIIFFISVTSMFLNFEFGLFLNAALLYSIIIKLLLGLKKRPGFDYFLIALICLAITLGFKYFTVGRHTIETYFIFGLFSMPVDDKILFISLFLFIFYHFIFVYFIKCGYKYALIFLFAAIYAECLLSYYFMCGFGNHIYIYLARILLPLTFMADFIIFEKLKSRTARSAVFCACLVILCSAIGFKYVSYQKLRTLWRTSLSAHRLFDWDLPGTNFRSTMNPAFFEDSIALINKYIPDSQKETFLISQYAPFINFLANKYSGFPHFDLPPYLMTEYENKMAVASVNEASPEYIFADSDIETPYEFDIVPAGRYANWLHMESRMRVHSLNEMHKVFESVAGDYEKIESSKLLTVYKKKREKP